VDADGDGKPDLPDRTPPELVSAHRVVGHDSLVDVEFSEPLDSTSAQLESNYTVYEASVPSNTVAVLEALLLGDGKTVRLSLERGVGDGYEISVSFVADTSCYQNEIEPGSTVAVSGPVTGDDAGAVTSYAGKLYQNYPNPFNPSTVIRFEVPGRVAEDSGYKLRNAGTGGTVHVELAIYDLKGRLVRTLVSGELEPGLHSITWDGTNNRGVAVSTGVYFYRLLTPETTITKKMVLIR